MPCIERGRLATLFLSPLIILCLSGCGVTLHPGQNARTSPTAKTMLMKVPPISEESSVQDVAAYVNYYKSRGFVITNNKQSFDAEGRVSSFQFAASRHAGTSSETVSATINAATHTVSTSSSSESSTTKGS